MAGPAARGGRRLVTTIPLKDTTHGAAIRAIRDLGEGHQFSATVNLGSTGVMAIDAVMVYAIHPRDQPKEAPDEVRLAQALAEVKHWLDPDFPPVSASDHAAFKQRVYDLVSEVEALTGKTKEN